MKIFIYLALLLTLVACGGSDTTPSAVPDIVMEDDDVEAEAEAEEKTPDERTAPSVVPNIVVEEKTPDERTAMTDPVLMGWWADRVEYDTSRMVNTPVRDSVGLAASGSVPNFTGSYEGPIAGTISTDYPTLTNPKVHLRVSLGRHNSIVAKTSFTDSADGSDTGYLTIYGARIEADGTFDSFAPGDNPTGFNGAFYGTNHEVAAGHIVTPQVFGEYEADVQ